MRLSTDLHPAFIPELIDHQTSSMPRQVCIYCCGRESVWIRSRRGQICWLPPPFIQPSHLMPTMNLLLHYLFDCQDGAHNQYAIHPFHIYWSGRLACVCVSAPSAQTNRLVESSGVGWVTAHGFDTGCLLGEMLSPLKPIYLKTKSTQEASKRWMVLDSLSTHGPGHEAGDLWGWQSGYVLF